MTRSKAFSFLLCVALLMQVSSCAPRERGAPKEQSLAGLKITVWDVSQPIVQGAPDYARETARVVAEFEQRHGVDVDLKVVGRQDIFTLLSGKTPASDVTLAYSTEWPFLPAGLPGTSDAVDPAAYLDVASQYWTRDGKMLAVPAYVHWVSAMTAGPLARGEAGPSQEKPRTAYIPGSAAFLRSVLDYPAGGWDPDRVAAYVALIKETYGAPPADPLAAWKNREVDALFPATPYLYQWLRDSGGRPVSISGEAGPEGEPHIYYTVPGYVVLSQSEPQRTAATRLGEALAANLGRWAARALACLPAASADAAVFQVDSRLTDAERSSLIQALSAGDLRVPAAEDFLYAQSLEGAIEQAISSFLSGRATEAEMRASIRGCAEKHTKP